MAKKPKTEIAPETVAKTPPVVAFKGFGMDWKCREFQFELNKTFKHEGKVEACASGFHACEHPLNVFEYYPPATSRYAEVDLRGNLDRHGSDTKIAAAEITIKAELKIPDLVARAIQWVVDRVTTQGGEHVTGDQSAASATGDQSAASATGDQSAASATGDRSAAMACGYQGSVSGKEGNALFLVERDDDYNIINVWAGIAGRDGVKADTLYTLRGGLLMEA